MSINRGGAIFIATVFGLNVSQAAATLQTGEWADYSAVAVTPTGVSAPAVFTASGVADVIETANMRLVHAADDGEDDQAKPGNLVISR